MLLKLLALFLLACALIVILMASWFVIGFFGFMLNFHSHGPEEWMAILFSPFEKK